MKTKIIGLTALFISSLISHQANAALALDATRYIYKGDTDSISVIINNESKHEYGAQVWVDNIFEKDTRPTFVATPSFFKVKQDGRQVIRIIKVSDNLPQDKESIYWLNLQEIPPLTEGSGLSLAIRTRVKLIYRPTNLLKERDGAEQNLSIQHQKDEILLVNTTPYAFAIGTVFDMNDNPIKFSKKDIDKLTMFMPGDSVRLNTDKVKSVSALNDYGNMATYELKETHELKKTRNCGNETK
ncbi:MAG: fimbria/pilus periplasmic chaperone [Plesiomonas shigelloides]